MFVDRAAYLGSSAAGPCEVESSERARQREIASYLSAASFPAGLPSGPLPKPILNADPTLNALVQLGALRLGCDRAFLSLIDRQYQFVVAEITRHHSLTEKRCEPNQHIFLGVTKLDACYGVCPTTMKAFMDETGEWVRTGPNVIANRTRYIINDFTTEPEYSERPYVVDYPYFRSYLEVPLVSPLGYLLGSYCVVHNDLYPDFNNDDTVEAMNEIASAIMAHLELRRMQQSRHRSDQLIEGLSGFIRQEPATQVPSRTTDVSEPAATDDAAPMAGSNQDEQKEQAADLARWITADGPKWTESYAEDEAADHSEPRPSPYHGSSSQESAESVLSMAGHSSGTPPTTPRNELDDDPLAHVVSPVHVHDEPVDGSQIRYPSAPGSDTTELPSNGFISSANIKSTLFRAATTIRQSMNMDGLMFLDAVPRAYADRSDQLELSNEKDTLQEVTVGPFCASIIQSSTSPSGEEVLQQPSSRLPEAVLQRFIRRFPQGHVFSADEFGPIDEIYAPGKPCPTSHKEHHDNLRLRSDVFVMFQGVPTAKYILFLPLWHYQQECWYAAALGWVSDPTRAFDPGDVSLVSAFGHSVMAEVSRLEALAASRAKSDFVSSISHELRSPLHGIMASSELLRESVSEPSLLSTLDMLDSCGTTLLDIFNNLLEHATITSSGGRYRTTMADLKVTDLAGLVEDVVDVVYSTHLSETAFQSTGHRTALRHGMGQCQAQTKLQRRPLLVVLDMAGRPSWRLPVDLGAWKRIVMNIFSNALKYTKAGHIQVTLREVRKVDSSGKPCDYISFSVQDTGQGMTSDYLKYKLFMPFSQENTHSPGMGLGLSIVQQLAQGLDGTVDVKSSVGVGTIVEVLAPIREEPTDMLDAVSAQAGTEHKRASYAEHQTQLCGRTVCLISPESYSSLTEQDLAVTSEMRQQYKIVEQALRTNASTSLRMTVVVGTVDHPLPKADIYLVDSDMLDGIVPGHKNEKVLRLLPSHLSPLVLLCSGSGPCQDTKAGRPTDHFTHLHHPLGPRKLATAFCAALKAGPRLPDHVDAAIDGASRLLHIIPLQPKPRQQQKELERTTVSNDAPQDVAISPPTSAASQVTSKAPTKTYHLLLVDDNPINIKLLASVVSKLKHTFVVARHGEEAVQKYRKSLEEQQDSSPFDMVFMDLSMPVMDGFEATRQIRQLESERGMMGCKIVALTGLSSESSRNEAFASGSNVFLTKPVKLNDIKRLLGKELGQQG